MGMNMIAHGKPTEALCKAEDQMFCENWTDSEGRPAGGVSFGPGFTISWQNGPLGTGKDRLPPNGAFVETVIRAVVHRMQHYQHSPFRCEHNAIVISHLEAALLACRQRTYDREQRNVEGTHEL